MIKFDPPPLFQPRVEKNFDPPTLSLNPPPKEKFRPPTSFWTIRTLLVSFLDMWTLWRFVFWCLPPLFALWCFFISRYRNRKSFGPLPLFSFFQHWSLDPAFLLRSCIYAICFCPLLSRQCDLLIWGCWYCWCICTAVSLSLIIFIILCNCK